MKNRTAWISMIVLIVLACVAIWQAASFVNERILTSRAVSAKGLAEQRADVRVLIELLTESGVIDAREYHQRRDRLEITVEQKPYGFEVWTMPTGANK